MWSHIFKNIWRDIAFSEEEFIGRILQLGIRIFHCFHLTSMFLQNMSKNCSILKLSSDNFIPKAFLLIRKPNLVSVI